MKNVSPTPGRKRISIPKRKAVGLGQEDWITIRPLYPDKPYPTLVEPKVEGVELTQWARNSRELIERLLWEKRSLLFRNFQSGGIDGFESFVDSTSDGERLAYKDRSTPRKAYGDRIYCTTIYPPGERIRLHNEGSYWDAWALKAYFGCVTPPETGGETPIGDVHRVYERIDPDVREEFARRQVRYVRNYNDGFSLPWQEVFQTTDRSEVEEYCRQNRIEFEWKEGDRLRTTAIRPAIRRHPRSGEMLWFNHAAFFHVSALEATMREALQSEFADDELPYSTYFGDGGSIGADVVSHILEAYDAEEIMFRWEAGDVHLIDNMRLAHARQPYTGDRLILVALTEAYSGAAD